MRRTGFPWPDIEIDAWRACIESIARTVSARLCAPDHTTEFEMPQNADARIMGIAAFASGTGPLLGRWLEDNALVAPEDLRTLLACHLDHARSRAERMHTAMLETLDLLHPIAGEILIIKGAYTRTRFFPEPATRPIADIDIVVPPHSIVDVEHRLRDARYMLSVVSLHPSRTSWVPPGVPRELSSLELDHADNPFTIEVHSTLERSFHGVRRLAFDARGHIRPWSVHPHARHLAHPVHLAYLAAHASEEPARLQLIRFVELILVMREEVRTPENWNAFLRLIAQLDAHRFVYPALALTERFAAGTVPETVLTALDAAVPGRMRQVVQRLTPARAQRAGGIPLDERFMWAHGPRETVLRALDLALPRTRPDGRRNHVARLLERIYRLAR